MQVCVAGAVASLEELIDTLTAYVGSCLAGKGIPAQRRGGQEQSCRL